MGLARMYKNIVSFKGEDGQVLGFHAENLDVAELDEDCWQAFESQSGEAFKEIQTWSKEKSHSVKDSPFHLDIRELSINVSQVCNLACTYCAADGGSYGAQKPRADLNIVYKQLNTFLKNVKAGESFSIRFFGGEPLLYPEHIQKMADYALLVTAGKNVNLIFKVITNATLIDDQTAQLLAKYNMAVSVSIDGTKDINDRTRPSKDHSSTTEMIMKSLKALKPYRSQLRVLRAIAVFGEHNLDILKTYEFLRELGFDYYSFSYACSENDAEINPLFIDSFKSAISEIEKKYGLDELVKIYPIREHLTQLEYQIAKKSTCGAGKSFLQTDTSGKLYACQWFVNDESEVLGELDQLFETSREPLKSDLVQLHGCQTCWARNVCGGGCMYYNKEHSGSKHTKDPYYCERQKAFIKISIDIFYKYYNNNIEDLEGMGHETY